MLGSRGRAQAVQELREERPADAMRGRKHHDNGEVVSKYLMEMLPAPLGCMLASMAIEDSEETLAAYTVKIDDEGVCIFHRPPCTLVL